MSCGEMKNRKTRRLRVLTKSLIWYCLCLIVASIFLRQCPLADDGCLQLNTALQSPVIDGIIEDVWQNADSVCGFTQNQPLSGIPCSEPTVAYFLQDSSAIYVAFKCLTVGRSPDSRSGTRENQSGDVVFLYLDTFHDKRNAYCFSVNAAGVPGDATISSNGSEENSSWDGVFLSAVTTDIDMYAVEMAIPWSTLRFDKTADTWGFNLRRDIPINSEIGYAVPVGQDERFTISNFACLVGVQPVRPTLGMELFPQIFYRVERSYGEESGDFQVSGDFNWAINSAIRLQTTINPDFSQVEADPFALNLSKYAYYFEEKRPFFTEGQEYFQPLGGVMTNQLELFYSRQVGRKLIDGSEVPLEIGTRMILKKGKFEFGTLAAKTAEKTYSSWFGQETEDAALFSVQRLTYQLFSNSTCGVMYAGKYTDDLRNDVISLDGYTSSQRFELTYQIANSYFEGISDWAVNSFLFWFAPGNIVLYANGQRIGSDFDVSEIGFVPWRGYEVFTTSVGPALFPKKGVFSYGSVKLSASLERELSETIFSHNYGLSIELALRNGWGGGFGGSLGREYELGESYNPKMFWLNFHGDMSRRFIFTGSYSSSYGYDYLLEHFARSDHATTYAGLAASDDLTLSLRATSWIQREQNGHIQEVTYLLRPSVSFNFAKGMSLGLYAETPLTRSNGISSVRVGLSYRYNFLPKSWLIVALNDYEYHYDDGGYETMERVFTVKLKHLFSW